MASTSSIKPAMPPPPGKHSNFVNPQDNSVHITVAAIVCPIVAGLFVIARVFTRTILTRMLGWDDYFSIAAMVVSVAYCVVESQLVYHGAGKHIWDVPLNVFAPANAHLQIAAAPLNILSLLLFKLSLLLLYLRLFRPSPLFRRTTYFVIGLTTFYLTVSFLSALLLCRPLKAYWTPKLDPKCSAKQHRVTLATTVMNLITDVMIFLLPMPMVWSLELRRREKVQVSVVFATGAFIVAVGAVRLYYLFAWAHSKDSTWNSTRALIWSILEINIGIITGCLPVLRPLIKRLLPPGKGSGWLISSLRLRFSRSHNSSNGTRSPLGGARSQTSSGSADSGKASAANAQHDEVEGYRVGEGRNETVVTAQGATARKATGKGDAWLEEEAREREGDSVREGEIRKTVGIDVV